VKGTTSGDRPSPEPGAAPPASPKQAAILDAALALFSEMTFEGTPVPLVAERAGVGAGTIYRYFASKEALGNAVFRRWKGEMRRRLVDVCPRGLSPRDEMAHWWRALWRFASDEPQGFAFLETHHHEPYLDPESAAAGRAITDAARDYIVRAQAAGAVRRDVAPELLIAMVFGAFTGIVKAAGGKLHFDAASVAATEAAAWEMLRAR
jgi:AcrR family transcriptional regulator